MSKATVEISMNEYLEHVINEEDKMTIDSILHEMHELDSQIKDLQDELKFEKSILEKRLTDEFPYVPRKVIQHMDRVSGYNTLED